MASPSAAAAVVPATAADLFDLLQKSGLYKPDYLSQKLGEFDFPADAAGAAAVLIRGGLLTTFQSRLLLAGKYRGFRLGTYLIRDQLGRGGMGTVYLAEHATLRRKVALKVLSADGTNQKAGVERFLREARSAAALDHPNIVRVFDVLQSGEMHYIVMEYVEGKTLDSLVQGGGAMAPGRAVMYISQAAAGLQHAYEKGFIHRDIKPANLMVSKDGIVKVLDMGLARSVVDSSDRVTEMLDDGSVVGTADYISPEQATNQPGVDIRADIYSLGATLFALVTGRPPFTGSTSQVLVQHQIKAPPSLADFDRTIAPGLAAVVAKMLAKNPADRYATPSEVIAALAAWLPNRDGAQKVMAGLSSSELGRNSGNLQNTLDQVLSGTSTRNLPTVANPNKRLATMGGAVAAGMLLAGGLGYAIFGGSAKPPPAVAAVVPAVPGATTPAPGLPAATTTAPSVRPQPTPLTRPKQAVPVTAARPKPVFTPVSFRGVATVASESRWYKFSQWGQREVKGVPFELLDPAAGSNVIELHSPNRAEGMPKAVTIPVGRPASALHFLGGVSGWGWPWSSTDEGKLSSPQGSVTIRVRVVYEDGPADEVEWQNGVHIADMSGRREVSGSAYAFSDSSNQQVRYLVVRPTRPQAVVKHVELVKGEGDNTAPLVLALTTEATATDRPAAVRPLYVLDLSAQQPFTDRGRTDHSDTNWKWVSEQKEGPGGLPVGLTFNPWRNGDVGLVFAEVADGRTGLGIACTSSTAGSGSAMLLVPVLRGLPAKVRVRAVYRTGANTDDNLTVRFKAITPTEKPAYDVRVLPRAAGGWATDEFETDLMGATTGLFEFHTVGLGREGAALLAAFDVTDAAAPRAATPAAPAGGAVVFRLAAADLPVFRNRRHNTQLVSGPDVWLGDGTYFHGHKADTVSEHWNEEIDGQRALGWSNLSGNPSAQIGVELEGKGLNLPAPLVPGRKYTLRLTYKTAGGATGHTYFQTQGKYADLPDGARLNLPNTDGEWKTVELTITKPADPIRFLIDNYGSGAASALYVREVTLSEEGAATSSAAAAQRFTPVPLAGAATATSSRSLFEDKPGDFFRLREYGRRDVNGVPFDLLPPTSRGNNLIMLRGTHTEQPQAAPEQVTIPVNAPAAAIHFLGGVGAWAWPFGGDEAIGKLAMTVRLKYADGVVEEFRWINGEHVVDWVRPQDVSGSQAAFLDELDHQVRHLSVKPSRPTPVATIELVKGEMEKLAPLVFAVTVESLPTAPATPAAPEAPAGASLYRFDPAALPEFRGTMQGWEKVLYGSLPKLPTGIKLMSWKATATGDFTRAVAAGRPALGFAARGVDPTAEVIFNLTELGVELVADREYVARLDYLTDGDAGATLRAQEAGGNYPILAEQPLASTAGRWQTAELRFKRAAGVTRIAVQTDRASEAGMVHIGRLEVFDPAASAPPTSAAPPAPPAARGEKMFALDLTGLPAFRSKFAQGKMADASPVEKHRLNWYCWKPSSVAEFRSEPTDRGPAVGVTNLNDDVSSQMKTELDDPNAPPLRGGQRYVLRAEYKLTNDATGGLQVRQTDYTVVGRADLPPTGGGWKWVEVPFTRPDGQKLHAILENTAVGEGNTLLVRAVELYEAK